MGQWTCFQYKIYKRLCWDARNFCRHPIAVNGAVDTFGPCLSPCWLPKPPDLQNLPDFYDLTDIQHLLNLQDLMDHLDLPNLLYVPPGLLWYLNLSSGKCLLWMSPSMKHCPGHHPYVRWRSSRALLWLCAQCTRKNSILKFPATHKKIYVQFLAVCRRPASSRNHYFP